MYRGSLGHWKRTGRRGSRTSTRGGAAVFLGGGHSKAGAEFTWVGANDSMQLQGRECARLGGKRGGMGEERVIVAFSCSQIRGHGRQVNRASEQS